MYYVYILESIKNGRYYIGRTSSLKVRLIEHNLGRVKWTKLHRPWTVFYSEELDSIKDATKREKQIKAWKSRSMIEKLKFNKIARPRLRLGEAGEDPRPRR